MENNQLLFFFNFFFCKSGIASASTLHNEHFTSEIDCDCTALIFIDAIRSDSSMIKTSIACI